MLPFDSSSRMITAGRGAAPAGRRSTGTVATAGGDTVLSFLLVCVLLYRAAEAAAAVVISQYFTSVSGGGSTGGDLLGFCGGGGAGGCLCTLSRGLCVTLFAGCRLGGTVTLSFFT